MSIEPTQVIRNIMHDLIVKLQDIHETMEGQEVKVVKARDTIKEVNQHIKKQYPEIIFKEKS